MQLGMEETMSKKLQGFQHGFFGGVCGVFQNKLFVIGSLKYHLQHKEIYDFVNKFNFEIIELYDGPFFDGGSILFLNKLVIVNK